MVKISELSDEEQKDILSTPFDPTVSAFDEIPDSVKNWLQNKGFKEIGHGNFSKVYGKNGSDKIVKINKTKDHTYLNFVMFCMKNPNPYLPKIFDYRNIGDNLYIYITEKLEPFRSNDINESNFDLFALLYYLKPDRMFDLLGSSYADRIMSVADSMRYKNSEGTRDLYDFLRKHGEAMDDTDTGSIIRKVLSLGTYDIHNENLMKRQNGQVVIIDPVF